MITLQCNSSVLLSHPSAAQLRIGSRPVSLSICVSGVCMSDCLCLSVGLSVYLQFNLMYCIPINFYTQKNLCWLQHFSKIKWSIGTFPKVIHAFSKIEAQMVLSRCSLENTADQDTKVAFLQTTAELNQPNLLRWLQDWKDFNRTDLGLLKII